MLTALQSNAERSLELSYRTAEHHGTTCGMLLYDTQTMIRRESLYRGDIRGLRSVLARELVARQVRGRALCAREPTYPVAQILPRASAKQHTHLQLLRRIGGS
jgi:hypothetical protein